MALLAIVAAPAPAGRNTAPARFLGASLKTHDDVTRVSISFSREFPYVLELSENRNLVTLSWPNNAADFPTRMLWPSNDHVLRMGVIPGRNERARWIGLEIQVSGAVESVVDFWTLDRPILVIDIRQRHQGGTPDSLPEGDDQRLAVAPMVSGRSRPGGMTSHALIKRLVDSATALKAQSRDEREGMLEDFFDRLVERRLKSDPPVARLVQARNWMRAAAEMRDRLWDSEGTVEDLTWLFLYGEFNYRSWRAGEIQVSEAIHALEQFTFLAPDGHELVPFASCRLAQIYRHLELYSEEEAHIAASRDGSVSVFTDLFGLQEAEISLRMGRSARAAQLLMRLVGSDPEDPIKAEAHYLLGEMACEKGAYVKAYDEFKAMIALTTAPLVTSPRRALLVGKAYVRNGHCPRAFEFLRMVGVQAQSGPPGIDQGEAWLLLAECHREEERTSEAVACYESINEAFGPQAQVVQRDGRAVQRDGRTTGVYLEATLNLAQIGHEDQMSGTTPPLSYAFAYQYPLEAARQAFRYAEDEETRIAAGYLMGRIPAERGDFDEAVDVYTKLALSFPDSPVRANFEEFIVLYFRIAVEQAHRAGDYPRILNLFKKTVDLADRIQVDCLTRYRHANALFQLDFFEEAASILRRVYEEVYLAGQTNPEPGHVLFQLIQALEQAGKAPKALTALRLLAVRHTTHDGAEAMTIRARCYMSVGEFDRAVHALEQVASHDTGEIEQNLTAHELLAEAYAAQKQWGAAELALGKGLERFAATGKTFDESDGSRRLMSALADLYYARGQRQSAVEVYEQYAQLYPEAEDVPMVLYRLGKLHLSLGRNEDADFFFDRLEKDFQSDPIYGPLAEVSRREVALREYLNLAESKPEPRKQ